MTPLETFRLIATEFSEISDEEVEKWFELSKTVISEKRFGNTYSQALALLTAHKLKMAGFGDNETGKISDTIRVGSYSEGSVSIGYTQSQANNILVDAEYALTSYGLQFLTLRRSRIINIVSAGEAR